MLDKISIENILFIDIETVPVAPAFNALDPALQMHWDKKSKQFRDENTGADEVWERAGIYAEFGKIICISAGYLKDRQGGFRLKSFFGDKEPEVLTGFAEMLSKFTSRRNEATLCAHNGREFDFPYIARRMIINRLPVPGMLDNAGRKPWEVKLLDTMDLWKFGDYKTYTSLDLLTSILGISTPKDDIDGSKVAGVYYNDNDLPRIVRYCEKDVIAIARILFRFMNLPGIDDKDIESVTEF